jgi:hypothetical protein
MKKLLTHFACLVAVALACCTLASCGDDDDPEDDSGSTGGGSTTSTTQSVAQMLVGTWDAVEGDEDDPDDFCIVRYTINADGTGRGIEHYQCHDNCTPDIWDFTWTYNEKTRIFTEDYDTDKGHDTDSYYVVDVSSTQAILCEIDEDTGKPDYDDTYVLKRVK